MVLRPARKPAAQGEFGALPREPPSSTHNPSRPKNQPGPRDAMEGARERDGGCVLENKTAATPPAFPPVDVDPRRLFGVDWIGAWRERIRRTRVYPTPLLGTHEKKAAILDALLYCIYCIVHTIKKTKTALSPRQSTRAGRCCPLMPHFQYSRGGGGLINCHSVTKLQEIDVLLPLRRGT